MLNNKKVLLIFFLIVIFFNFFRIIYERNNVFFNSSYDTNYENLRTKYYSSQYATKNNTVTLLDEYFEEFAGGAFLKGMNPIHIVHDHPPLGRYIISLSILLFNNSHIIIIPLLLLSAIGVYLISREVLKNSLLSLLPLLVFLNEPLFLNKLVFTPLPEAIQLPFIIFSMLFFIKGITSKKYLRWFVLTSLMLGGVISTRFFVLGAVLCASMFVYFILGRQFDKKFLNFVLTLPLTVLVLLLSYTRTMFDGYSPIAIFGIQRYILEYHQSKFIEMFSFWDLLFFNRWHTWWDGNKILSDPQWIIAWPISMVTTMVYTVFSILKKIKLTGAEKIILIWIFFYCAMLSSGYTSTRYFLPLIPFLYIISLSAVIKLISVKQNTKKK